MNNLSKNIKWQVIFLAVVILLLYFRTLSFNFIGLDEETLLVRKRAFNKEFSNIPKAFTQHVFQTESYLRNPKSFRFYRPLFTASLIFDAQFAGSGYMSYRLSNILFHFIASVGLLFVLNALFVPALPAFLLSCLFAVHPMQVQAIAWIPGRNDSLVALFVFWSLLFLIKYIYSGKKVNFIFHCLFFTAAIFTKENAMMFSFVCLFYIFLVKRDVLSTAKKFVLLLSYCLITVSWFMLRSTAVAEMRIDHSFTALCGSFCKSFPLLIQYFQKTILPVNLAVMSTTEDTNYRLGLLAIALFGAGIYFTRKIPWKMILLGILWFFLFLLPTLLFSYFEGMEHRAYLPLAGLLIAFAGLKPVRDLAPPAAKFFWIAVIITISFTVITFMRVDIFKNELSYWKNAAATSKHSAVVCRDLGIIHTKMRNYEKAENAFLEAIRRNPKEELVHYNLGAMYLKINRLEEAQQQLLKEIEVNPSNYIAFHVLGVVLKKKGRVDEAKMLWEKTIMLNPDFIESHKELLSYYALKKDTLNLNRCIWELEKRGLKVIKR